MFLQMFGATIPDDHQTATAVTVHCSVPDDSLDRAKLSVKKKKTRILRQDLCISIFIFRFSPDFDSYPKWRKSRLFSRFDNVCRRR